MRLTFVAKDPESQPEASPTLYRTVDAGEDVRYVPRPGLTDVLLPGSGDFYVFDDSLVLFLHYAGNGTNTAFEVTDQPRIVQTCRDAFETVWSLTIPFHEYRPDEPRRAGP